MKEKVERSLTLLLDWIKQNGNSGYDPYDIYSEAPFLLSLQGDKNSLGILNLSIRYSVHQFNLIAPRLLRKILRVRPMEHATFFGNMYQAHSLLHITQPHSGHRQLALEYKEWLLKNRCKGHVGNSWGTPFNWRSGDHLYNTGTPFAVVCAWVGDAFYTNWEQLGTQEDLHVCQEICTFMVKELPRTYRDDGSFCFSYSPMKSDQIHNANLFVAEFLMRVGIELDQKEWVELADNAWRYSVADQQENGLIPYFSLDNTSAVITNDSYHGSYEIRMLFSLWKMTNDPALHRSMNMYLNYYRSSYLQPDGGISLKSGKDQPIDITSMADGIMMFSMLGADMDTRSDLDRTLNYCIDHMQDPSGSFYYRRRANGSVIKIPYIRWGQGWMALALSRYLSDAT